MSINNKINLMIVDDEKTALDIIIDSVPWSKYNMEAFPATDGENALEIIADRPVDIVITDIKMPRIDGLELIRRIHALNSRIICIVMSSYNEFDLVRAAMQLGAYDYLFKPTMMPEDIIKVVQDVLQKDRLKNEMDGTDKSLFPSTDRKEIFRYC